MYFRVCYQFLVMMKGLKYAGLIFLLVSLTVPMNGCSKFSRMKRQENQRRKDLEKEKAQREKESQQAYEDAIKRHYEMQDKETQKMMKKTARKSARVNENRREFFLKRWFTPKQKKSKPNRNQK